MSGSVNKVILVGNLGRDPETRTFPSGDKVVSFSMAMTESWRDKATGERKDKTEWVNVSIFNEALGRIAEQYCKKGSKIYLEGQLQTREYTDKDGNQRKATDVVLQKFRGELTLLDSRGSRGEEGAGGGYERGSSSGGGYGGGGRSSGGGGSGGDRRPAAVGGGRSNDLDDDIPF
jgi:single-strand DNA-binding protein